MQHCGLSIVLQGPQTQQKTDPARLPEVRCSDGEDLEGTAVCGGSSYLALRSRELDEGDALQLLRLPVCRQAHRGDLAAILEHLGQGLADLILALILVKPLDKDGCRV